MGGAAGRHGQEGEEQGDARPGLWLERLGRPGQLERPRLQQLGRLEIVSGWRNRLPASGVEAFSQWRSTVGELSEGFQPVARTELGLRLEHIFIVKK